MTRRRSFWGWGWEDECADPALVSALEPALASLLGIDALRVTPPPRLDALALPESRLTPPAGLSRLLRFDVYERAAHTYGKSYRDLVRGLNGDFARAPDCVAYPEVESDVVALLDWCASKRVAAIPYGGGSSVCGGVEADVGTAYAGAVSIDMTRLGKVLEVNAEDRSARIQGGALGPALEEQLRVTGHSLRHYPQSFEFSTFGGWLATRSGGHFATLYTHIDELVQSLRVVTPSGVVQTRSLPGSGAGPSPDRLFLGSEGSFGIITEASVRIFERPRFRARFTAQFSDFFAGARAAQRLAQAGLFPANCRLLDPMEAMLNGAASGESALLLVGFESSDHELGPWIQRAAECCRDAGGKIPQGDVRATDDTSESRGESADAWRRAFIRAPYLRDALVQRGVFVETFETAVLWSGLRVLHAAVTQAARQSAGARSVVTCRLTHVYADGAAPYFTVIARAEAGNELAQMQRVKDAITSAMLENGGTTTHHHAVGRDSRKYYERETPELVGKALMAAKIALDPLTIMNPGVLFPAPA